jgi:hypothetical protein
MVCHVKKSWVKTINYKIFCKTKIKTNLLSVILDERDFIELILCKIDFKVT